MKENFIRYCNVVFFAALLFLLCNSNAYARAKVNDFDGDGITDYTAMRGLTNGSLQWYIFQSANSTLRSENFGYNGNSDAPIAEDFDGDNKVDIAVYRTTFVTCDTAGNTNTWYILKSSNNQLMTYCWGVGASDPNYLADYDGDNKVDPTYPTSYCQTTTQCSNLAYTVLFSGSGSSGTVAPLLNNNNYGHYQMRGRDFNGDGKDDFVIIDRSGSTTVTNIKYSSGASTGNGSPDLSISFGVSSGSDALNAGYFDSDSKADLIIARRYGNSLDWYILNSTNNTVSSVSQFGNKDLDLMAIGYYDSDSAEDIGVIRNDPVNQTKSFYAIGSTAGFIGAQWGIDTDKDFAKTY